MAKAVHELDPSADTIIVLKNPGAPFAIWKEPFFDARTKPQRHNTEFGEQERLSDEGDWGSLPIGKKTKKKKEKKGKKGKTGGVVSNEPVDRSSESVGKSSAINGVGTTKGEPGMFNNDDMSISAALIAKSDMKGKGPEPKKDPSALACESLFGGGRESEAKASSSAQLDAEALSLNELEEPTVPVDEEDEGSISYLVSSRHLALASGYFKSSLADDGWIEGQTSATDGKYHLSASDWDPEALLILLQILHLRNRSVPRSPTLEMLAKVAVLVDYYRCREAVEVLSEIWINNVKLISPVPSTYGRDLVLWMCIAWVFKLPTEFKQTTSIAFRQTKSRTLQHMFLPIPNPVLGESFVPEMFDTRRLPNVDRIELKRYQAIKELVSSLHGWLDKFRGSSYSCKEASQHDHACSSMLLGALTKAMDRLGCWLPRPVFPFQHMSFDELYNGVDALIAPTWNTRPYYDHPCGFQDTVIQDARRISEKLAELDLWDFKDRGDN
jgi:hypothetical protein